MEKFSSGMRARASPMSVVTTMDDSAAGGGILGPRMFCVGSMESRSKRFTVAAAVFAAGFLAHAHFASAYTENTLHAFCSVRRCTDGSEPLGELAMDQSGNLYGTTYSGGNGYTSENPGYGTVFEFVPGTGQYEKLYKFCELAPCTDGANPGHVRLVIDTSGNLYGTTESGGNRSNEGVVFELIRKQSGWREKVLYNFCSQLHCHDGAEPLAGLTYAGAATGQLYDGTSPLYGATAGGGEHSGGTVYSVAPKGTRKWGETVLYSFCSQTGCTDGAAPDSALFVDSAGNLYGTTDSGGLGNGTGTVFELSPNGTVYMESVLYSFCSQQSCADGTLPQGGVVMDGAGNLFGTTEGGGSNQDGLIFKLSPSGSQWQYNTLANFDGADGNTPQGSLLLDSSGNLFGTTTTGGSQNEGTVFEFNGSIQTLYSFCPQRGCPDGDRPIAGVILDSVGNLYGTASNGGTHKTTGTMFELSP
jgi:uncharacterized repeat protein (TIGR03803 family)